MSRINNLKFGTKILLFGISSVLLTVLVLVATVVWQSGQFNALAQYQNNTAQTAASLDIPLRTLYRKIKKYRLL